MDDLFGKDDLYGEAFMQEEKLLEKAYSCQCCNAEGKTVVWDDERKLYVCTACGKTCWGHTKKAKEIMRHE